MSIVLGERQRADAPTGTDQTWYPAASVVLVVEVVSPESQIRDRERKPQLYAGAGIPHFWRLEDSGGGRIALYVYELDPATRAYGLTGIYRERVKVAMPFEIGTDLTEIERL